MNQLLSVFMLTAISQFAFSQHKIDQGIWHLTVVDSANSKSIAGATVTLSKEIAVITNTDGLAVINKEKISKNDHVKISCIGYKTLTFNIIKKYPDTIRLATSILALHEVVVTSQLQKIVLGNVNEAYAGGYLPGPNQEVAEFIPNTEKISGTITSVEFALLDGHKGIKNPFKVNLYAKNPDNIYPQAELVKDNIIVCNPNGLTKVSVDLSKYHIEIPKNGFFVSFQTLPASWYGNNMVTVNGHAFFRVPGIKGVFKDHHFNFDREIKAGCKYSLLRTFKENSAWNKFEYGTDFAIGATIDPQ